MSERPASVEKRHAKDRSITSVLGRIAMYAKAWFSWLLIGASSATALLFVIFAEPDTSRSGKSASTQKHIAGEGVATLTDAEENSLTSEPLLLETTPIQEVMLTLPTENSQPPGVELTTGGDFESDSPVRLLGVIEIVDDGGSDAAVGSATTAARDHMETSGDLLAFPPAEPVATEPESIRSESIATETPEELRRMFQ